jgi:hypothetical protein
MTTPGWRELGGATLLLTAMAFAVFGWYAFNGGFLADDWVNADRYYFHPDPGFWGAVDNYQTPSRPVAAVWVTLTYAVLGTDFDQHLILSVLLAAFLSIAFYAFLRTLGVEPILALAAAAVLLVFPMSDSTRLWSTGSQINLFIGLYLVAAVIAIYGRRRFGPKPTVPAVATQVLASAFAVTAVAGYEIVAPAVLLSFGLYRWAGGRGGSAWRWALDAVPTVLVLIFFTSKFGNGGAALGTELVANARLVTDGALWVLSYTFYPSRTMVRWTVVVGLLGILFIILLVRRIGAPTPDREAIVRWLRPILLSIGGIAIGYLMIVPAADRYPLYAPGVQNRTNCFAALGFSTLTVFVLAAVAALLVAVLPRLSEQTRKQLRGGLAGVLVLGLLAVYTVRISEDADRWVEATDIQKQVLETTQALVPSPPPDATFFTSPAPGYSAPSVPIFGGGGNNDAVGAFKVAYDSDEMRAFPLFDGVEDICGRTGMSTPDAGNSETEYGKAILVDLRVGAVYRPAGQRECLANTEAMKPFGPLNLTEEW